MEGTYSDATGAVDMTFDNGTVRSMGTALPYQVKDEEIHIQGDGTTLVLTRKEDGSLHNPLFGTLKKQGSDS